MHEDHERRRLRGARAGREHQPGADGRAVGRAALDARDAPRRVEIGLRQRRGRHHLGHLLRGAGLEAHDLGRHAQGRAQGIDPAPVGRGAEVAERALGDEAGDLAGGQLEAEGRRVAGLVGEEEEGAAVGRPGDAMRPQVEAGRADRGPRRWRGRAATASPARPGRGRPGPRARTATRVPSGEQAGAVVPGVVRRSGCAASRVATSRATSSEWGRRRACRSRTAATTVAPSGVTSKPISSRPSAGSGSRSRGVGTGSSSRPGGANARRCRSRGPR